MTVTCRPATDADAEGIAAVRILGWQQGYAGVLPQDYLDRLSVAEETERLRGRGITDGHSVAETGGEIVGWSFVGPYRAEDDEPDAPAPGCGEVHAIYVLPDRWGQGVGRALMAFSLERLGDLRPAYLWVLEDNPRARRFYEAYGWRTDGAAHTFAVGGATLPEVRYRYGP